MASSFPASEPTSPEFDVIEGGTDAASMLIFDPAALPEEYEGSMRGDPLAIIEPLANAGTIYWLDTHADGGYSLGVCHDELRPELRAFARQIGVAERFAAPSGKLYFAGIEYAFRDDDSFLRKHPHMGSCLPIAAGIYRLTVFDMEYPEDFHEALLRQRLTAGKFWMYSLMNWLAPLGCISALATIVSAFAIGFRWWCRIVLPLGLALVLPALILSRLRPFRAANREMHAIQREYPGFVAVLSERSSCDRETE
jgi:hypothetical protein